MRNTIAALATAGLLAVVTFAQTHRTFYFTPPVTQPEIEAMVTTIRTVVDLHDISVDKVHQSLVIQGEEEKAVAAEWLFHHLDGPGGGSAPAEYKMFGDKGEVIAVIPASSTASIVDLYAATTAVRGAADVQRVFLFEWRKAIVGRDTPEKIAAAEWVVRQLSPHDGQAPTRDSPPYPMEPLRPDWSDEPEEIRVFRMGPKSAESDLTSMVTAIRTVADLQLSCPFSTGRALIVRGPHVRVAVAEWLVHQMANPAGAAAVHQTTMPGLIDGVVRLFYFEPQTDINELVALVTRIRAATAINRTFPFSHPPALILRGRPDQMSAAEALVGKFAAGAH